MAKRAPDGEKPFRPLDVSVLNSVVQHVGVASLNSCTVTRLSCSNIALSLNVFGMGTLSPFARIISHRQ